MVRPYWKLTIVVAPRGFTVPLRMAENAATLVAGLVVTTGVEVGAGVAVGLGVAVAVGLGVDVGVAVGCGVGVGVSDTTLTVPTMAQHPPCGTQ